MRVDILILFLITNQIKQIRQTFALGLKCRDLYDKIALVTLVFFHPPWRSSRVVPSPPFTNDIANLQVWSEGL